MKIKSKYLHFLETHSWFSLLLVSYYDHAGSCSGIYYRAEANEILMVKMIGFNE